MDLSVKNVQSKPLSDARNVEAFGIAPKNVKLEIGRNIKYHATG